MERVVLITDIDTTLGSLLAETYYKNGEKVIGISSADKKAAARPDFIKNQCEIFEWKRHSAIDAKNVIIEVLRKYRTIDEALIVQSIPGSGKMLPEVDISSIDKTVDYWIKGNLFLTREILSLFSKTKKGVLAFVDHKPADEKEKPSPLEESVRAAFSGFIRSILSGYLGKDVFINGFESTSLNESDFAQFIYKNMSERFRKVSGKFAVHQGSKGIFGSFNR